jgi:hypothetical protein
MPTAPRPARSLLALALVVNLIAASAPTPAFGSQLAGDELVPEAPAARVATPADGPDRAAAARARVETTTASRPLVASVPAGWTSRPRTSVPEPKPTAVAKASARDTARTGAMRGRNHVWIPALGINKSVSGYACSSSYYPGNRVYRWGCAGSNNVYLFGHAHSVFKPLHDAYVRGKLRKGMRSITPEATAMSRRMPCRGGGSPRPRRGRGRSPASRDPASRSRRVSGPGASTG